MVRIRYQTPAGATQTWDVEDAAVKNTDASCEAYLTYWHPNYVYLGREGYSAVRSAEMALQPPSDPASDAAATQLIDDVLTLAADTAQPVEPAATPDAPAESFQGFQGGDSGGGGASGDA